MRNTEITIRATEHPSAHEAIQHLDVSGDDHAILVGNKYLTLKQAESNASPRPASSSHTSSTTKARS